jgi:hypothetical protein
LSFKLRNSSAGAAANTRFQMFNDVLDLAQFGMYGSGHSGYGAIAGRPAYFYANTSLVFMADSGTGAIKFASGGNSEKARIDDAGNLLLGTTSNGSGVGIIALTTTTTPTSNPPVGTYYFYIDPADDKAKLRGSSGTITILAVP